MPAGQGHSPKRCPCRFWIIGMDWPPSPMFMTIRPEKLSPV